jgi:hypothetical protein
MADLQPKPQPRRRLNADRKASLSAAVSPRALIVLLAILASLAQEGMKPQWNLWSRFGCVG